MASACVIISRQISTSSACHGKRNFRKFLVLNKRGSRAFKEERAKDPNSDVPIDRRGVKFTGIMIDDKWVNIPEMVPELIVPSLKDFPLKPYVSYRVKDIPPREYTARDLFNLLYAKKVKDDFENGKLEPNGEPLNPSEDEKLTAEEARNRAGKTGADIFTMEKPE